MPNGWERLSYLRDGWGKGQCVVVRARGIGRRYMWLERNVPGEHRGFQDAVSCAVACELATGGCTGGHA